MVVLRNQLMLLQQVSAVAVDHLPVQTMQVVQVVHLVVVQTERVLLQELETVVIQVE